MNLNKLTLTRLTTEITDSVVDQEKLDMCRQYADRASVDGPAKIGDLVHVDYSANRAGGSRQAVEDVLGEPKSMASALHDQIIGMNVGELKEAPVTFGEGHSEEGNTVTFKIFLHHIIRYELPDLDETPWIVETKQYDSTTPLDPQIRDRLSRTAEKYSDIHMREQIERFVTGVDSSTAYSDLLTSGKPVDNDLVNARKAEIKAKIDRKWMEITKRLGLSATSDDVQAHHELLRGVDNEMTEKERKALKQSIERDRVVNYIKNSVKTEIKMLPYDEFKIQVGLTREK